MSTGQQDLLPPLLQVTSDDHGPWVIVASTLFLILTILVATVTLISRIRNLRMLYWSDVFICGATLVFFPETVCINLASSNGLGRHQDALSDSSFQSYGKFLYASEILSIIVLACSRAAVALLVLSLEPFKAILVACRGVLGIIGLWAAAAVITLAVQCDSPYAWDSSLERCLNQEVLFIILAVCSIITDLAVILLPIALVWNVQITTMKRLRISALFGLRIIVPVCTILGLISMNPYFHSSPLDRPWHALTPVIWFQVVQSLSILCACIPTLRRVLAELQTGMMGGSVSNLFELSVSGGTANMPDGSGTKSISKSGYGVGPLYCANNTAANQHGPDDNPGHFAVGEQNKDQRYLGLIRGQETEPTMAYKKVVEPSDSLKNLTENHIIQPIDYELQYHGSHEQASASSSSHDMVPSHSAGWSSLH